MAEYIDAVQPGSYVALSHFFDPETTSELSELARKSGSGNAGQTSGGRQRTDAEYRTLLGRSGLRLTRVVPSTGRISLPGGSP